MQINRRTSVEIPPHTSRIRVLLADDETIIRRTIGAALREQPEIELVGEASDGFEVVEMIRRVRPDVVLMDVNMPGFDGIEATRTIQRDYPEVRVIGLSVYDKPEMAIRMRDIGAEDYFPKGHSLGGLVAAILHRQEAR